MMHHVASYCGLRVIDHCHFVAESWCFLVVFRCWTSRRKLASRPCFTVHDLHIDMVALSQLPLVKASLYCVCFPPLFWQEEVRVLSKFRHPNLVILMGFAKNGSMTSVEWIPRSKLHGWASPSHRLRPGRLLVYEHLGGGDVFNRLQKCTCDNAGSSVFLNNIWNDDLI